MTREEAKYFWPIIKAYSEGKTIEYLLSEGRWADVTEDFLFDNSHEKYRIKQEPKYRPFTSQDECWDEMLKHEPMGWVKGINVMVDRHICLLRTTEGIPTATFSDSACVEHEISSLFGKYTFADGAPFGVVEY